MAKSVRFILDFELGANFRRGLLKSVFQWVHFDRQNISYDAVFHLATAPLLSSPVFQVNTDDGYQFFTNHALEFGCIVCDSATVIFQGKIYDLDLKDIKNSNVSEAQIWELIRDKFDNRILENMRALSNKTPALLERRLQVLRATAYRLKSLKVVPELADEVINSISSREFKVRE